MQTGLRKITLIFSPKWKEMSNPTNEKQTATMDENSQYDSDDYFRVINEKGVDDISLEVFYKPHTITLLSVSVIGLLYSAFTR